MRSRVLAVGEALGEGATKRGALNRCTEQTSALPEFCSVKVRTHFQGESPHSLSYTVKGEAHLNSIHPRILSGAAFVFSKAARTGLSGGW